MTTPRRTDQDPIAQLPPPARPLSAPEQAVILNIHRAVDLAELWKRLQDLFDQLVPYDCLNLSCGYLDWRRETCAQRWVRRLTPAPSTRSASPHRPTFAAALGEPFHAFIERHPNLPAYSHSQVEADAQRLTASPLYRHVMTPQGWRYSAHILIWSEGVITTSVAIRRRADQGDFTEDEMALLQLIQPHIATAIEQINRVEEAQRIPRQLESFFRAHPEAVLFLDWKLRVIYASDEAVKLCAGWNYGMAEARRYNAQAVFAVPPEITTACAAIKGSASATDRGHQRPKSPPPGEPSLPSPRHDCVAEITLQPARDHPGGLPVFCVRLKETACPKKDRAGARVLLNQLTPTERQLATLICEGLSNRTIAERLGKTEGNVKVQVSNAFQKLRVENRAQLIVALRPALKAAQ